MKQEVLISISGKNYNDEDADEISMSIPGTLFRGDKVTYLSYTETDEGGRSTDCKIKIYDEGVELIRTGAVTTRMVFQVGVPFETIYGTPVGELDMVITTMELSLEETDEMPVNLSLEYNLEINERVTTRCELRVQASCL